MKILILKNKKLICHCIDDSVGFDMEEKDYHLMEVVL